MNVSEMIKNVCWNILCLRVLHRLTKKEMAARLGISVASLRKLEAGGPLPRVSVDIFYRIADSFGVSAETLMTTRLIQPERSR